MNSSTAHSDLKTHPLKTPQAISVALSGGELALHIDSLTRPLEHLDVTPQQLRPALYQLIEQLPLLLGDELCETLEEPHAATLLERQLSARTGLCCEVSPHAVQSARSAAPPPRPLQERGCECLILLASSQSFKAPSAPRPRQSLKEALAVALERFEHQPHLKLILLVSDAWDPRLMREHLPAFQSALVKRGQALIPTLHHGGLLTPICYL